MKEMKRTENKRKKKGRRYQDFPLFELPIVEVIEYTDPERKVMAEICRIYQGMHDADPQRPIRLIMKEHDSFLEALNIQVKVISSIATRDQALRNRLATAVAARGFRANVASQVLPPHEIWDDPDKLNTFECLSERHIETIDEMIQLGFKPQEARALLGLGAVCEWTYRVNARLLVHSIFKDRLWVKGHQKEIGLFAQRLYEQLHKIDPELWEVLEWVYGPETLEWRRIGKELRKLRQDTPIQKYQQLRGEPVKTFNATLWDGRTIERLTVDDFYRLAQERKVCTTNLFGAITKLFGQEKTMWD